MAILRAQQKHRLYRKKILSKKLIQQHDVQIFEKVYAFLIFNLLPTQFPSKNEIVSCFQALFAIVYHNVYFEYINMKVTNRPTSFLRIKLHAWNFAHYAERISFMKKDKQKVSLNLNYRGLK